VSESIEDLVGAAVETVAGLESLGEAVDDAWTYVTDLAATSSDAARSASDRSSGKQVGTISRQSDGSDDSPFMTALARTSCAGDACAMSSARRATSGSDWIPA